MHGKTLFVCLTFAEVNYFAAYPARKGSGNHNHLSRNESVPGGTQVRKCAMGNARQSRVSAGATFRTILANCRNIAISLKFHAANLTARISQRKCIRKPVRNFF
jgi:hypothetical protein